MTPSPGSSPRGTPRNRSPQPPKPTLLAFHGSGSNGMVHTVQLARLSKHLRPHFDIISLDGTYGDVHYDFFYKKQSAQCCVCFSLMYFGSCPLVYYAALLLFYLFIFLRTIAFTRSCSLPPNHPILTTPSALPLRRRSRHPPLLRRLRTLLPLDPSNRTRHH
jgi:hypothetical protein